MDTRRKILYYSELTGSSSGPINMDAITKLGLYCLTGKIEAPPVFLYPFITPDTTPGVFTINGEIMLTVYGNLEQEFVNTETEETVPGRIVWQEIDVDGHGDPLRDFGDFATYKRRGRIVDSVLAWGTWRNPMNDAIDKNNAIAGGLLDNRPKPKSYDASEGVEGKHSTTGKKELLLSHSRGFAVANDGPSSERWADDILTLQAKNLIIAPLHYSLPDHNEALELVIDEANEAYVNIVLTNEPDQYAASQGYVRCQFTPDPGTPGKYTLRGSAMGTSQGVEHTFTGLDYPATFRLERRGDTAKVYMNGAMLADTASAVTTEEPDEMFFEGYYYYWQNMITFNDKPAALRRVSYERLGEVT